jgi:hypothetical protein
VTSPDARTHIAEIIGVIIEDERLRRTSAQMKAAMKEQPMDPTRFAMPVEEMALRQYLLSMDPFNFERHSMSFFHRAGWRLGPPLQRYGHKLDDELGLHHAPSSLRNLRLLSLAL